MMKSNTELLTGGISDDAASFARFLCKWHLVSQQDMVDHECLVDVLATWRSRDSKMV